MPGFPRKKCACNTIHCKKLVEHFNRVYSCVPAFKIIRNMQEKMDVKLIFPAVNLSQKVVSLAKWHYQPKNINSSTKRIMGKSKPMLHAQFLSSNIGEDVENHHMFVVKLSQHKQGFAMKRREKQRCQCKTTLCSTIINAAYEKKITMPMVYLSQVSETRIEQIAAICRIGGISLEQISKLQAVTHLNANDFGVMSYHYIIEEGQYYTRNMSDVINMPDIAALLGSRSSSATAEKRTNSVIGSTALLGANASASQ